MKGLAILTLAAALLPAAAEARGVLVSPAQLGLHGAPGSTVSGVLTVRSPRPEENTVRVSFGDYIVEANGKRVDKPSSDPAVRSSRPWLEVDQESFKSPERGTVSLIVTARIPDNAAGSYWATLFLEVIPKPKKMTGSRAASGFTIIPRLAVPVIVTVAGTEQYGLAIRELTARRMAEVIRVAVLVENTGNTAVMLNGALTIEQEDGDSSEELAARDIEPTTSYPGAMRRIEVDLPLDGAAPTSAALHAYIRFGPAVDQVAEASAELQTLLSGDEKAANGPRLQ